MKPHCFDALVSASQTASHFCLYVLLILSPF